MLMVCFLNKCVILDLRECIQKCPILAFLCALYMTIYVTV